jgi:PAS domain S-box-containing protein
VHVELPPLGESVGSFRFLLADQRWEWSAEVARMHGYEPGNVMPTTELVLAHKHPDDKPDVAALIDRVSREGHPFSSRHRIIDTKGRVRHVVVVADQLFDDDGQVIGTAGFYIDMTDAYESDVNDRLDKALGGIAEARATIEQAKGILMFVYGLTADRAFDLLQWRSQATNIKLRDISSTLVRVVTEADLMSDTLRRQVDHFLLTAHQDARPVMGGEQRPTLAS